MRILLGDFGIGAPRVDIYFLTGKETQTDTVLPCSFREESKMDFSL